MAELDQSSFAYLKGNINFAIYSLKLVAVAPHWSGKVPSGFIILMEKEGMAVNVLAELLVSRAPLGEVPSPSWMWLNAGPTRCRWAAQAHMPGGWVEPAHTGSQLKKEMSACGGWGVGGGAGCRRKAAAVKEIGVRTGTVFKGFCFCFLTLLCCLFCLAFDHYWKVRNSCHHS